MWQALAVAALVMVPGPGHAPEAVIGTHVPWAAGGPHQVSDGTITSDPESWPDAVVPSVRLWDTRTTWADLEPSEGDWQFAHLDRLIDVAHEHGTDDVLLVLAGTPAWAADDSATGSAPWLAPGAAAPPARMSQWRDFVDAVAARYRGVISAYQIGNEVNMRWFWQGTPRQLHRLVKVAAREIHRIDPQAGVVAPGPLVTSADSFPLGVQWWRALGGTGVDAVAVQWYPPVDTRPAALESLVGRLRRLLANSDLARAPIWLTEVNHETPSAATPRSQAALIRRTNAAAQRAGVSRIYWYAWSALVSPELVPLQGDSPGGRVLEHTWNQRAASRIR